MTDVDSSTNPCFCLPSPTRDHMPLFLWVEMGLDGLSWVEMGYNGLRWVKVEKEG